MSPPKYPPGSCDASFAISIAHFSRCIMTGLPISHSGFFVRPPYEYDGGDRRRGGDGVREHMRPVTQEPGCF